MVKTTYALTLFAAVSLAAPIPNPDGSGNLVGAGADSALGGAVQQLTHTLGMRDTKKTGNQHKNLIEEIPIIGKMLGNKHDAKRDTSDKNAEHKNLIEEIPIVGSLLGKKHESQRRGLGGGGLSSLPIVGGVFGEHQHSGGDNGLTASRRSINQNYHQNEGQNAGQNEGQNEGQNGGQNEGQNEGQNAGQNEGQNEGQNDGQNDGQNEGQNNGQNEGQNDGQNDGQNEGQNDLQNFLQNFGQNSKRDLSQLSSLPIVGELFGKSKDQEKSGHKQTDAPAKQVTTRAAPGHSQGIFGILQSLTSGGPETKSHAKRGFTPDSTTFEDENGNPINQNPNGTKDKKEKDAKDSNNLLANLMGPEGLGSIKGNAQHGVGLFPARRDTAAIEAREAPIQGSTLTDVLFSGGALGKLSHVLTPGAPEKKPGESSPKQVGDGSQSGPPDPASGAGPHSGPGLAAEQEETAKKPAPSASS
ncbi:uncharacterized protein N7506_007655 [Penicillium brevicompactum]|uniref:uncharacterized protein n=1 Tax=Penicillium brevicompactum TaxID=5074 RepID=UPI00253FF6AF|nr:uncharacterized protein N7506_007655 [Penicillium brevicompactum]KAJ5333872.1 hypothetical protein N7506_007655 [Penicillium brevicompactum]